MDTETASHNNGSRNKRRWSDGFFSIHWTVAGSGNQKESLLQCPSAGRFQAPLCVDRQGQGRVAPDIAQGVGPPVSTGGVVSATAPRCAGTCSKVHVGTASDRGSVFVLVHFSSMSPNVGPSWGQVRSLCAFLARPRGAGREN